MTNMPPPKDFQFRPRFLSRPVACLAFAAAVWPAAQSQAQDGAISINRPVSMAQAAPQSQPRRATRPAPKEQGPSAEELNRRFIAQLETDRAVHAAPPGPPPEPVEQPGFFGRIFGSAPSRPEVAQVQSAPAAPQATPAAAPSSAGGASTTQPRSRDDARPGFFGRMFGVRGVTPPTDSVASLPTPASTPSVAQAAPSGTPPSGAAPTSPGGRLAQAPSLPPPQPVPLPPRTPPVAPAPVPPAPQAAPVPVPVPPPPPTGMQTIPVVPAAAPPAADRAQRDFGRAVVVPTEAPTMQVEVSKGTMVRLRGPATTVFVANPEIADVQVKSPTSIYVFGKKPGETSLYATDERDGVLLNTIVRVTHEHSRLQEALRRISPGTQLQFTTVGDTIIVNGTARNAGEIQEARRIAGAHLGNIDRVLVQAAVDAPSQVLLRVRVVEAQRQALKRVGINWESVGRIGSLALGLATPTDIALGAAGELLRQNSPAGGLITLRNQGTNRDINGVVDLLATENFISILAEPNLVALSGETASFLAGGEFPVVSVSGVNQVSVNYKQFGVSLAFTPTIYGDGRINLKVRPEVSQLSTQGQVVINGFTIPALTTRRAETTVELGSGQSFMIGGLINNTSSQDIQKLPGLGDIPILGALFRSDAFQRNETELVILVTPYIVRPSSGRLMTPADGMVPPNDADRYLYGRTYRQQPAGQAAVRRAGVSGGFMID